MKIMTKPILRNLAKIACCLILLYVIFTPNISMVRSKVEDNKVPFEAYMIESVSVSLPSGMGYVPGGMFDSWRYMSFLDFAEQCLNEADVFEATVESMKDMLNMMDTSNMTTLQRENYSKVQSLVGEYSVAKIFCYAIGYCCYLVPVLIGLEVLICIINIAGLIFAKEEEKKAFGQEKAWGAIAGFFSVLWLIMAQIFIVGPVNKSFIMAKAGYIYQLVFTGGMHYLIPTIAAIVIYAIACAVINKVAAGDE